MELPDYRGGSLVNLMTSIVGGLGGEAAAYPPLRELAPSEVARHRRVLLLVVDGLGDRYLREHPAAKTLNAHHRARITSVFPTTTAAAITTFLTADAPQQHGLTGWHMHFRELGAVLAVLPGRPRYGGADYTQAGVNLAQLFRHKSVHDRIGAPTASVCPSLIGRTPYNRAHLGQAQLFEFEAMEEFYAQIERAVHARARPRFIYAYWPELDHLCHLHGVASVAVARHLQDLDRGFAKLLDRLLGTDTLVLLTADHGMIDALNVLDLDAHATLSDCLTLPLCGEPRVAWAYVRHERRGEFEAYIRRHLSGVVTLRPSRELVEEGWFGFGAPHPELLSRLGDYALLMHDGWIVRDRLPTEETPSLIGMHGGLTAEELFVPLVTASV